jgi:aspartate aminotransferase-like enzyme
MKKKYLLTPGPTPVAESTMAAMGVPIIHHRHPEFQGVLAEVRGLLKELFQTKQEVLILCSSGTGAMEGTVVNCLSKGDRVVVVRGGKFGERWEEISKAYGLEVDSIEVPWGQAVDPAEVKKRLAAKPAKAVMVQATETSTGVAHPVKELAALTRNTDTLLLVDGVTGVGVSAIPFDEWGLDALLTGSQKALMLPPGLAFACLSDKAWKAAEKSDLPKYYFNFKKEHKKIKENSSNYTPAITLIIGLREVLSRVKAIGFDKVYAENARMARAARAAMAALGLELYAPAAPSNAVTAVKSPAGINAQDIVKIMREEHGVTIAGGQDQAKGKIFRIAHMGHISPWDLLVSIGALETTLTKLGHKFTAGAGVAALLKELAKE